MPETILDVVDKPRIRFVVRDHSLIMATIYSLIDKKEACNFCGAAPIVIVYRDWEDRIVTACKAHEEIVLEMMERDT